MSIPPIDSQASDRVQGLRVSKDNSASSALNSLCTATELGPTTQAKGDATAVDASNVRFLFNPLLSGSSTRKTTYFAGARH
jgi:hypothetical protein